MYQVCPKKRGKFRVTISERTTTYANISTQRTSLRRENTENGVDGVAHAEQMSQSEAQIHETGEQNHIDRQPPPEGTTNPNIKQGRERTPTGEGKMETTDQQEDGGQKIDGPMEVGDTIPAYMPVKERAIPQGQESQDDILRMTNKLAMLNTESDKEELSSEGPETGTSQRDGKTKIDEKKHSPKRSNKMPREWTGEQPHKCKLGKTRRSHKRSKTIKCETV